MTRSSSNRLQPTRFPLSSFPRPALLAVLAFVVAAAGGKVALAQDQAVIDRLVQLNKKAMDDFDTADFDAAKKSLLDAEKSGKKAGLETHPVMARTYVHLGAVYLMGFKDKQKAQHYFEKALDIQSDIRLDRNLMAASLKDAFAAAAAKRGGGGAMEETAPPPSSSKKGRRAEPEEEMTPPATESETESGGSKRRRSGSAREDSGGEPDLPKKIEALDCPYPNDTPPGKKLTLRCAASPKMGIENVNLYYKGFEMTDFESLAMEKSPKGWWQAVLPKKVVDGKSLQFYFEGLDVSDQPVVSNGRAESPNVMLIVNRSGPKPKKRREEEDPLATDDDALDRKKFGNRRFWFGLSVGSGVAFPFNGKPESLVNGYTDQTNSPKIPAALEWAGLLHLVPTIGFSFNPNWAIAIEGRNQYILRPKGVSSNVSASGAHAVLIRLLHYSKQQRTRMFWGIGGGGGEGVRGIVTVNPAPNSGTKAFQDTVLFGPILLTGGIGILVEVTKTASLVAQGNAFFSLPNSGVIIDGTIGVQFGFGDASGREAAAAKLRSESVAGSVEDEEDPSK